MTHFEKFQAIVDQTDTSRIRNMILSEFTIKELMESDDLHFDLDRWDKIAPFARNNVKQAGYIPTLSYCLCLTKHVARIIINEEIEKQ